MHGWSLLIKMVDANGGMAEAGGKWPTPTETGTAAVTLEAASSHPMTAPDAGSGRGHRRAAIR